MEELFWRERKAEEEREKKEGEKKERRNLIYAEVHTRFQATPN